MSPSDPEASLSAGLSCREARGAGCIIGPGRPRREKLALPGAEMWDAWVSDEVQVAL